MLYALLYLILGLCFVGVLYWAAKTILGVIPMDAKIKTVILVLFVLVACIVVFDLVWGALGSGGIGSGLHSLRMCP